MLIAPAVFLPLFSCVTWRIANHLAARDVRISFCKDRAFDLSPTWTALNTRFCRRNKPWRNCLHFRFIHDSVIFLSCLTILRSNLYFLNTLQQLRCLLPTLKEFPYSSSLHRGSTTPRPGIRFFSFPQRDCYVPLGVANSTIGFPGLLPLFPKDAVGISPIKSGF